MATLWALLDRMIEIWVQVLYAFSRSDSWELHTLSPMLSFQLFHSWIVNVQIDIEGQALKSVELQSARSPGDCAMQCPLMQFWTTEAKIKQLLYQGTDISEFYGGCCCCCCCYTSLFSFHMFPASTLNFLLPKGFALTVLMVPCYFRHILYNSAKCHSLKRNFFSRLITSLFGIIWLSSLALIQGIVIATTVPF